MNRQAKKEKCGSFRDSNTVFSQCWSPRYNVSVLLPCGGCHPEELIVVSLIKLKVKLQNLCVKMYICGCMYICVSIYVIYICVKMYLCACMYLYLCVYIYIYIYIYIYYTLVQLYPFLLLTLTFTLTFILRHFSCFHTNLIRHTRWIEYQGRVIIKLNT